MTTSPPALLTATDLERINPPGKVTELIRGRLVVREPPGTRHGAIAASVAYYISAVARRDRLGVVFAQDTGFKIESDPDSVRAPDVAFVVAERAHLIPDRGYAELAPDLAVEVLSPDDRTAEVLAKTAAWLEAGVRLVWLIDPRRAEARIYRKDGSLSVVASDGMLEGEDVLPGFSCLLKDVVI